MRIIAGRFRSRQIMAPAGEGTRPTSDRLRETLFNVLAPRVPDSVFLDLYAGSGAVGIEALSRGAKKVYAVEAGKKAVRAIEQNLATLGIEDDFELIGSDVASGLRSLAANGVQIDICVLDPPYREHGAYEQVFRILSESQLIADGGIVIAEHEKHFDPGDKLALFKRYRTLRQGDAVLSFYHQPK
jgi:16S rRNA (guanine(966)-N(2))-methyltransferase RsmD